MTQRKLNVRCVDLTLGETAMRKFLILTHVLTMAMPVAAEGFPPRPESCRLIATTQKSDCEVENIYRCSATEGSFYHVEMFDNVGPTGIRRMTEDYVVESSIDETGDGVFVSSSNGIHPREMIRLGTYVEQFDGIISMFGMKQPIKGTFAYAATGETVELAGKTFSMINGEFSFTLPNTNTVLNGRTVSAYQEDLDLFLEVETAPDLIDPAIRAVELYLPGQAGFGDENARHGCKILSSHGSTLLRQYL